MTSRLVTLGLLFSFLFPWPARSADNPLPDAWRWSRFTVADGLPSNFVVSTVDVPGDTLWAVTRGGLTRYDGYRWHPVALPGGPNDAEVVLVPMGQGQVAALTDGLLYAGGAAGMRRVRHGFEARGVKFVAAARAASGPLLLLSKDLALYEWDGRACRPHQFPAPLGRVHFLWRAGPRTAWVSTDRGLASWDGAAWRLRLPAREMRYSVLGLYEEADGTAWAYVERPAAARGLWFWAPRAKAPVRRPVPSPISALAALKGHVIAVHATGDLTTQDGARWVTLSAGTIPALDVRSLGMLFNGDLAVSSDHGLLLYRASARRWSVHAVPPPDDANSINEIARGPDGMLWLGTSSGLTRLAPDGRLVPAAQAATDSGVPVTGLAFDARGRLWICSGAGFRGVRWRDEAGWHRLDDPRLDDGYFHRIVTDRRGGLWFLGLSDTADRTGNLPKDGPGAFRLAPDGQLTRWGQAEGLPSGRVYAFAEAPDGAYWFGTLHGLSRWKDGRWQHWTTANGLRAPRVFTVAVARDGTVWFGHQSPGLGCLRGNTLTYFGTRDGLAGDVVWTVRADEGGRVWVAAEGGVSVREGDQWTTFETASGLPNTRVWPVLPEADRVYFGTAGAGLAALDFSSPAPAPRVLVDPPLAEPHGVVVRWKAFSWWAEVAGDAIFTRVRLDDQPWSSWTTDRERRFVGLAPGRHVVRVQAKGLLGVLGAESAPVAVTIEPPLFRRPAVYVPLSALALVIAGLVGLMTVRQREHRLELRERETLFTRVFGASPLPTAIARVEDGQVVDANAALERFVGCSRQMLLGRTLEGLDLVVSEADREKLVDLIRDEGSVRGLPLKARRSSGEALEVLAYLEVFALGGRKCVLVQLIDVTEQHRLQLQLQQAQKMESVGRLAGGVAHDFNNLLTVILGNTALVDGALAPGDPLREELEQVKIAAERAERLTRQLLAFARKQVAEPRVLSVNDVVLGTHRMLRRLIGEDIELVTITPEVWPVYIDPGQLEQVLLNMAVNARDAMPDGGKLTVTTSNLLISEASIGRDPETEPGEYVRMSIADTGVGMDGVTAARVFDPFFTTKEAGKGTGLGLAMCYGIVKQARGQILVETRPGRGTTFHVDLPRASAALPAADARESVVEVPRGQEVVLLVEDEVQVRRLAASVLRQRGYEVIEASGGPEALELARRHPGRIDVLLTDLVMPQMPGFEVARALKGMRPALKVLYMSGYTDDDRFRQEAGREALAFLAKPFTPTTLARLVREVLDADRR